jgi:regulator of protease activity HflC (stomatin/prohibitin superfamily)
MFIVGLALLAASIIGIFALKSILSSRLVRGLIITLMMIGSAVCIVWSSALFVEDNQGGLVIRKFGSDLQSGKIIATNGEKGPQAKILPSGWHFGYPPWLYNLESVDNINIPQGKIGIVTARDGSPLPAGDIFGREWDSPSDMLDAEVFLNNGGERGPQLTVLPPGQYRYNPRLFNIELAAALNVPIGTVAVIKSNVGPMDNSSTNQVEVMNGVPIVPKGNRGIWNIALTPNQYYLHPQAYEARFVQSTKRLYTYELNPTKDESIRVRTSDGYEFPVDVRVSVKVSAENAPFVVAMLGDPDSDRNQNGFDILEEKAILPSIRSIFRNSAESANALAYVNSRSTIENSATEAFKKDMQTYKINVDKVYVADIRLDDTEDGKILLKTQTDKELAENQKATYQQQVLAQAERAKQIEASEQADQKKNIAAAAAQQTIEQGIAKANIAKAEGQSLSAIKVAEGQAKARLILAQAEADARMKMAMADADYNAKMVESLGGVDNYTKMQLVGDALKKWQGGVPTYNVSSGSGGGSIEAILSTFMMEQSKMK